jgi:bisphosphoglycerate-independent phosphoglycerate mutase (AlkP superfamily)
MTFKGNNLIFSNYKKDRIKGYRKAFKKQEQFFKPSKAIAKSLIEAMEAQGYDVTLEEAIAYLKASIAVHNRDFFINHRRR